MFRDEGYIDIYLCNASKHRGPSFDDLGVFGVISKKVALNRVYREAADGYRALRSLRIATPDAIVGRESLRVACAGRRV
jgi:hypothetical protein